MEYATTAMTDSSNNTCANCNVIAEYGRLLQRIADTGGEKLLAECGITGRLPGKETEIVWKIEL